MISGVSARSVRLLAFDTEDRLAALEARLSRLEQNLGRLLEKISKQGPTDGLEGAKTETEALSKELQATKEDAGPNRRAAALAPQEIIAGPTSTPVANDAGAEIQNVPYAGYMETDRKSVV